MQTSNMKNIVVLKNLPSNLIDEAIVILKSNKKVKNFELIDRNKNKTINNKETESKGYILKEAEMIISDYIADIEKKDKKAQLNNTLKEKYNRLKKYSFILTLILFLSLIINFI